MLSDLSFHVLLLCPHSLSPSAALPCSKMCHSLDVALWSWSPQNNKPSRHLLFITYLASGVQQQKVDQNSGLRTLLGPRGRHCLHSDDAPVHTQPQDSQPPLTCDNCWQKFPVSELLGSKYPAATSQVTTQRFKITYKCSTNSSGLLLSSSYILS